jgi:hypothetical protein
MAKVSIVTNTAHWSTILRLSDILSFMERFPNACYRDAPFHERKELIKTALKGR